MPKHMILTALRLLFVLKSEPPTSALHFPFSHSVALPANSSPNFTNSAVNSFGFSNGIQCPQSSVSTLQPLIHSLARPNCTSALVTKSCVETTSILGSVRYFSSSVKCASSERSVPRIAHLYLVLRLFGQKKPNKDAFWERKRARYGAGV